MTQEIPDLVTLQGQLLDQVLAAGLRCGVTLSLCSYRQSPRLALMVRSQADASLLLAACAAENLKVYGFDPVCIWRPIIVRGRMLHGTPSGIELYVADEAETAQVLTFPHPAFENTWLNDHLKGRTLAVQSKLLKQLEVSQRPKQVDIVITWVDDQDPAWQTQRALYRPEHPTKDATDTARFTSNDELLFTLRGVFRYFDGIKNVYLVTDGQTPHFWDEFADRVIQVDHSDIMGPDVARPTFNSHVIESCLHNIPNLGEHYIYLNDDVIITNATGPCDFYDDEGRAKVFYSHKTFIPTGPRHSDMLAADAAAVNARDLFASHFGQKITRKFQHGPIAITRSVLSHLEVVFADQFAMLRQTRFRSQADIAPSGSLYQQYALMTHQAVAAALSYRYVLVTDFKIIPELLRLNMAPARSRPTVLCLNAVTGGAGSRLTRYWIRRQMSHLLPHAETRAQPSLVKGHLFNLLFSVVTLLQKTRRR